MSGAMKVVSGDFSQWTCRACGQALAPAAVELEYMGSVFNVELPACPACGQVLVPEDLALGKMAEVEQLLEDK
ncbi:DVU_1557 family redox protein [Desulfocurvus sp. DL9XJH121]